MTTLTSETFQKILVAVQEGKAFLITAETQTQYHKSLAIADSLETAAIRSGEELAKRGDPVLWVMAEEASLDEVLEYLQDTAEQATAN